VIPRPFVVLVIAISLFMVLACVGDVNGPNKRTLFIGGIPDQDVSILEDRFNRLAEYLSKETGLPVRYVPSTDYAAVVTGFRNDSIQLAWYGGLTGVQARLAVPAANAIAQRPRDAAFHSVFIKRHGLDITSLEELSGFTLTFGSESSTSGYLMPLFFLNEAGIHVDDLKAISFSGSHDVTWKLVESGAFDVGVLNAAVWDQRIAAGDVDLNRVEAFFTTEPYPDYHWVARGDIDREFGDGVLNMIRRAILDLGKDGDPEELAILEAFQGEGFVPAENDNYRAIEQVARDLGIIE
jgi:phosphonate transport system substrate-binding protein